MQSGGMMYQQLSIASLIDHAARYHGDTEIVSAVTEGGFERLDWATVGANARRIASALVRRGMKPGDRIALIAETGVDFAALFCGYGFALWRRYSDTLARKTFRFSLIHLSLLFAALLVDHYVL